MSLNNNLFKIGGDPNKKSANFMKHLNLRHKYFKYSYLIYLIFYEYFCLNFRFEYDNFVVSLNKYYLFANQDIFTLIKKIGF